MAETQEERNSENIQACLQACFRVWIVSFSLGVD